MSQDAITQARDAAAAMCSHSSGHAFFPVVASNMAIAQAIDRQTEMLRPVFEAIAELVPIARDLKAQYEVEKAQAAKQGRG